MHLLQQIYTKNERNDFNVEILIYIIIIYVYYFLFHILKRYFKRYYRVKPFLRTLFTYLNEKLCKNLSV